MRTRKWPLAGPFSGRSIAMIALLDDHHPVAVMMAPSAMPSVAAMHFGACAVAMMIAAALDDDGLSAGYRRRCDGNRAKGCDDKTKFPHDVLLSLGEDQTANPIERSAGT